VALPTWRAPWSEANDGRTWRWLFGSVTSGPVVVLELDLQGVEIGLRRHEAMGKGEARTHRFA